MEEERRRTNDMKAKDQLGETGLTADRSYRPNPAACGQSRWETVFLQLLLEHTTAL
jgi:hypothetical protein